MASLKDQAAAFRKRERELDTSFQKKFLPPQTDVPRPVLPTDVNFNLLVFNILEHLKDHRDKSFTIDDFKALKAFQSADFSHPSLLDVLKTNPRIEYLSDKNAFTYRPNYKLNSKEDLLNLLRQAHLDSCDGIDYSTLKDFPLLQPSVADLERENLILVIKDSKNLPKMLFYNDTSMSVSMSQEFQELWKSIVPPNEMELKRQLNAAGLRETQVEAKEVVKPPLKQVQSRKKRKTTKTGNRTNKHLEDFD